MPKKGLVRGRTKNVGWERQRVCGFAEWKKSKDLTFYSLTTQKQVGFTSSLALIPFSFLFLFHLLSSLYLILKYELKGNFGPVTKYRQKYIAYLCHHYASYGINRRLKEYLGCGASTSKQKTKTKTKKMKMNKKGKQQVEGWNRTEWKYKEKKETRVYWNDSKDC